jgi:hypothetical protein
LKDKFDIRALCWSSAPRQLKSIFAPENYRIECATYGRHSPAEPHAFVDVAGANPDLGARPVLKRHDVTFVRVSAYPFR